VVLDNGGERFDPVAAIKVMDFAEHFVGGGVDVSAHDAEAIPGFGESGNMFFKVGDVVYGGFDASFDGFAKRPVLEPAPGPPDIVGAIEFKECAVAPVSEMGEPDEIFRHGVKDIAMQHEITAARTFVDVFFYEGEVFEIKWEKLGEDVVVVAAYVDDLGVFFLQFFEYNADEACVGFGPAASALELPAVDNIAVEDKFLAADVAEEMVYLSGFTFGRAEVDVGENNSADAELIHGNCRAKPEGAWSSTQAWAREVRGTMSRRLWGWTRTSRRGPVAWVSPSV